MKFHRQFRLKQNNRFISVHQAKYNSNLNSEIAYRLSPACDLRIIILIELTQ